MNWIIIQVNVRELPAQAAASKAAAIIGCAAASDNSSKPGDLSHL
jgi:hypothetical protein